MILHNALKRRSNLDIKNYIKIFRKTIKSGNYILGDELKRFEKNLSKYTKSKFAIGVGNGTDAIYLSLASLNLSKSDKVLLQANAGGFSFNSCNRLGLKIKFVDCDKKNGQLLTEQLNSDNLKNAKVLIVSHLFGQIHPDIEKIKKICDKNKIILIEDCAQAIGSFKDKKHAGSWGKISTFSFYPIKNLGAFGDGGAIITNKKGIYQKLIKLRNYGWGKKKFTNIISNGINSRLDEIQSSILSFKLKSLDKDNKKRREIAKLYLKNINNKKLNFLNFNINSEWNGHLFILLSKHRDSFMHYLNKNKIESSSYYPIPDYNYPFFDIKNSSRINLKNTNYFCNFNFSLPIHPDMKKKDIFHIIKKVNSF